MTIKYDDMFLQKYLEHLERRASQDGINKWLLIAGFAAVMWQLLAIFQKANLLLVLEWTAVSIALFFVVELIQAVLEPSENEEGGLRLVSKAWVVTAESKNTSFLVFKFAFLLYAFAQHFEGLESVFRITLIVVFGLFLTVGVLMLVSVFRRYEAKVPSGKPGYFVNAFFVLTGAATIYGLYGVFHHSKPVHAALDSENIESLKTLALILASLFIVSKYLEKLRIDSEIIAVRRLWKRVGVGEVSLDAAKKELRLIVFGASLGEVISADVAELSRRFSEVTEEVEAAERELSALPNLADQVAGAAIRNSLSHRSARLSELVNRIGADCEAIKKKVKSLVGEDGFKHADCSDFLRDLETRCAEQRDRGSIMVRKIEGAATAQ